MKSLVRVVSCLIVGVVFLATQSSALIISWDVAGHGTPADPTLAASTYNQGDIANVPTLARVGLAGTATANAFNSNNSWNNTATFIEGNHYVDFFVTADGSPIVLQSLGYAVQLSASAPNQLTWGFSINGGAFTTTTVTMTSASPSSLTTWTFGDTPTVASGQSVEFRMWVWGTTSASGVAGNATSNGTGRIANVSDGDLVLNYSVIPEPSTITLIGLGLVGLLGFVRRRQA